MNISYQNLTDYTRLKLKLIAQKCKTSNNTFTGNYIHTKVNNSYYWHDIAFILKKNNGCEKENKIFMNKAETRGNNGYRVNIVVKLSPFLWFICVTSSNQIKGMKCRNFETPNNSWGKTITFLPTFIRLLFDGKFRRIGVFASVTLRKKLNIF